MSCCGESRKDANKDQQQAQHGPGHWNPNAGTITQQPGVHPPPSFNAPGHQGQQGYPNQFGQGPPQMAHAGHQTVGMGGAPQQPPTSMHQQYDSTHGSGWNIHQSSGFNSPDGMSPPVARGTGTG